MAATSGSKDLPDIPELAGDYQLVRELGRGGTSVVYLARDRDLGRDVAIKLIRPAHLEDEDAIARLVREARTVSSLQHPNIVMLLGTRRLGRSGLALILQFIPGRTLKARIREEGPLPVGDAEQFIREIGSALAYAHRRRIVHRDIKPENVYLDEDAGLARLADFGIARAWDSDSGLTLPGTAIGTPTYMSPEQVDGGNLDGRSDLYSLGLLSWEMLTGRQPWAGETLYGVIYRQKHDDLPDVQSLRPDVPPALAHAIRGAMAKDPAKRWQTADEFLEMLDRAPLLTDRMDSRPERTENPTDEELPGQEDAPTIQYRRPDPGETAAAVAGPGSPATRGSGGGTGERRGAGSPGDGDPLAAHGPGPVMVQGPDEQDEEDVTGGARRPWGRSAVAAALALLFVGAVAATLIDGPNGGVRSVLGQFLPLDRGAWETDGVPATRMADRTGAPASREWASGERDPGATPSRPTASAGAELSEGEEPQALAGAEASLESGGDPSGELAAAADPNLGVPSTEDPALPDLSAVEEPSAPDPSPETSLAETSGAPSSAAPSGDSEAARAAIGVSSATRILETRPAVVTGGTHTCRLAPDGSLYCWGSNGQGQLGDAGPARRSDLRQRVTGGPYARVSTGFSHSCALDRAGRAYCWGRNDAGQLGDGSRSDASEPVRVDTESILVEIEAGATHTCALADSGAAFCWGSNEDGQLGDGSFSSRATPVRVQGNRGFRSLALGWRHTCALDQTGAAYCWGAGSSGELGGSDVGGSPTPEPVAGGHRFRDLSAGSAHVCGVSVDLNVLCWGSNDQGQLGDGSTEARAIPTPLDGGRTFNAIATGAVHSCALTPTGAAFCWGRNLYGQVGDGTTVDRRTPVEVVGGHRFRQLHAFGSHSCGQTQGGIDLCWGYNAEGQLGDGTTENRTIPARISSEEE